jgi:mRNA-degrading endonuclease RelE of RelBE toxin-antitoxin system
MRIFVTEEFEKRFSHLPKRIQQRADKQKSLFEENPLHPSLHVEKLVPKQKQLWSMRIDRTHRILFRFLETDAVVFLTVGTHDWVYNMTKRF